MTKVQILLLLSLLSICLNIPFGLLRTNYKKFSLRWFLCIHAPIPIIAFMRITYKISPYYIPVLLFFSILGQTIGYRLKGK